MNAAEILRACGLLADGPVLWGKPVNSRQPGIFLVELSAPSEEAPIDITRVRAWVDRVPGLRLDGERPAPTELEARLRSFWLPEQRVLYVGRTTKALGPRVAALYATELGDRRPHPGGAWLKTLHGLERLRVWWAETAAVEEYEDGIETLFSESVSEQSRASLPEAAVILPWANLESVTGEKRATGITNWVLAEGEAPAVTSPVARTSSSGSVGGSSTRARSAPSTRTTTRKAPVRRSPAAPPPKPVPAATHVTADGLAALQSELEELRTVKRPEVILRVKNARELGDLRENAEYQEARNEQSFLEGRIQALEDMLRNAQVIETAATGQVMLGSTVRVTVEGEEITFHIVGSTEADPANGRISNASPVGKALIGHRAGDSVIAQLPGRDVEYVIVEVG
jgi:transcription elongation factor GreA